MIIKAIESINGKKLNKIKEVPGYYKLWAKREELDVILEKLDVSFDEIKFALETKSDMFCIYVGISKTLRSRLNSLVNGKDGAEPEELYAPRLSILSIVGHDQHDKDSTDNFIDKLEVECFYTDAETELENIKKKLLEEHFMILNIKDNERFITRKTEILKKLKQLRAETKEN